VTDDSDAESWRLRLLSIVDDEFREALRHVSRGVHSIMFAPCEDPACAVSSCVSKRNGALVSEGLARFFAEPEVGNRPPLVVPSTTHEGHYRTFLEGYSHLLYPSSRLTPAQAAERARNLKGRTDECLPSRKEQFSNNSHALAPGYCDFGHDGSPEESTTSSTSERCSRHFTFLSMAGKYRHQTMLHWHARKARMRSSNCKSRPKGRAKNAAIVSCPVCSKKLKSKRALARHKKASPACHCRRQGPVKLKGPFQKGQVIDEARAGRLKEDSELISSMKSFMGDDSADEEAFDLIVDMKVGDGGLPSDDDDGESPSRAATAEVDYFGFASYIPERVLDSKVDQTGTAASRCFRVKWKGFSPDQATWKSEMECQNDPALAVLVAQFQKGPPMKPSRSSSAPTPGMRRQLSIGDSFRRAPGRSQPRDADGVPITIDRVHASLRPWFPSNPMSDLRPLDAHSPGMLTDAVVNAACHVYKEAYGGTTLSGFQNTTLRDVSNGWDRHNSRAGLAAVNVLNTGGLHWLTTGQTKAQLIWDVGAGEALEHPTVRHFALDSSRAGESVLSLPEEVRWDMCQLYGKPSNASLPVAYPRPHQQLGGVHCGGYALAFMWAFCEGSSLAEIANMVFDQSTLYATVWATLCTGQVVPFEYRTDQVDPEDDDDSGDDRPSLCVRSLVRAELKGVPARRQSRARSMMSRSKKGGLKRSRSASSALGGKGSPPAPACAPVAAGSKSKPRKSRRIRDSDSDSETLGAQLGHDVTDITDHEPPVKKRSAASARRRSRRRINVGAAKSVSQSSFDWLDGLSDDDGQSPVPQSSSSDDDSFAADRAGNSSFVKADATSVDLQMETDSMDGDHNDGHDITAAPQGRSKRSSGSRKRRRSAAKTTDREDPLVKLKKARVDAGLSIALGAAAQSPASSDDASVGAALGGSYVCPGCSVAMSRSGSHLCGLCRKPCHVFCFSIKPKSEGFGRGDGTCPQCFGDSAEQPVLPPALMPSLSATAPVASDVEVTAHSARDTGSGSTSTADDDGTTTVRSLAKGSVVGIYAGGLSEEPFFLGTVLADPSTSEDGSVDIHWMELNTRNKKYELMKIEAPGACEPVYRSSILAEGLTLVDGRLQPSDAALMMEAVLGGVTKEDATPDGYGIVSRKDFESLLDNKHSGKLPPALRSKHMLLHSRVTGYAYGRVDTCKGTTVEGHAGATVGIRYPVDPNDPTETRHPAKTWKKSWYLGFDANLFRHTYDAPSLLSSRPGWVLLRKKTKKK
jgi:hypothetical protein